MLILLKSDLNVISITDANISGIILLAGHSLKVIYIFLKIRAR